MNTLCADLLQDKQLKRYTLFLLLFSSLLFLMGALFCTNLTKSVKTMLLSHDELIVSSLIEQGVPAHTIAAALTDTETGHTPDGAALLTQIGFADELEVQFLPPLHQFKATAQFLLLTAILLLSLLLFGGSLFFLTKRENLYRQASSVIGAYLSGDYSHRLPQTQEGNIYHMFSCIDQLATMLQAQSETEHNAKIFLRNMISDISHQLKTPLAALSMYQEIMAQEPDHPAVIQEFSEKMGSALSRMELLIQSLLKIARLDTGNISFEKHRYGLSELMTQSIRDLTTRAENEKKTIILSGSPDETLSCDLIWTSEAIGNLVKNALDHTDAYGTIKISWDTTPIAAKILISDNGHGILPEDIHHIFKRFYRSRTSQDTPGIGLGLPLAKSIIEGQNGTISVQSAPHMGTTFILLFP